MPLDIGQFISEIRTSKDEVDGSGRLIASAWSKIAPRLGPMFDKIQDAVNQTASAAGVDATQHKQSPDPPAKLNVKVAGEMAHVTIEDHSARDRSLHYFVETSNSPSFSAAHVEHLGVSRGRVLNLPTKDDNGNTHKWYFRAYSMSPGSEKPSPHVYFGQKGAPTPVQMAGSTNLSLLPSTGSGTTPTNGQKPGQGYGHAQVSNEAATKGK
jgi:hypothetical protein